MYPLAQRMATAERCVISWWHNEKRAHSCFYSDNSWSHFRKWVDCF